MSINNLLSEINNLLNQKTRFMKNVNLMLSSMRRIMLTVFLSTLGLYAMAQNTMEVSGTVKDEQGLEVIGASVMEEGATNGVITDINGQFIVKKKWFANYTNEI